MKKKTVLGLGILVALGTTAGYLIAAIRDKSKGRPSKKAPQVPISNPGEQSEFSTSASESELG